MHLDEERLQRLLHGEREGFDRREAEAHLRECPACRERLAAAEHDQVEIFGLLRRLDHPVPALNAEVLAAKARAARRTWGSWAAAVLLFLGIAGAAAALPGSPVRRWIQTAAAWIGERRVEPAQRGSTEQAAGIAAVPGREFVVSFNAPEQGSRARVSLTDGAEVVVRAPSGAASFTSDAERLVVDNHGSGATYEIEIPRTAPHVEIRVGGNRIFLKEGSRVVTRTPAEDGEHYLLPLAPTP
jgi:anti-sigma factor RsiW